jgi:membrane fusion protein (multidrug efflux system)
VQVIKENLMTDKKPEKSDKNRDYWTAVPAIMFLSVLLVSCGVRKGAEDISSDSLDALPELSAVSVEVLEVTRGSLVPEVEASGIVRGIREAWAVSETQGRITEVLVSLGQSVEEGDVILRVEDDLARLKRDVAFQQYESALVDFQAIESSYQKGGVSRSEYNSARSRVLSSQSTYESANKAYRDTAIRAPFDGSVAILDSSLSQGNYLNPGVRVARIVDTSSLKMEISVGERRVRLIEPGLPAFVETDISFNGGVFDAVVEAVGSGSDPGTGSFPVLITWDNPGSDDLRSGISARVTIATSEENQPIVIPSSALVIRDRKQAVFVVEGSTSRIRPVETGDVLGGRTIVSSGLSEGDVLIISALSALGDGYEILATSAGTTGEWR